MSCGCGRRSTASWELHISSRVIQSSGKTVSGDVLLEPKNDFMETHGLAVAHAVMQTGSDLIAVQVLNPHRIPVVLRKGEKLGCLNHFKMYAVWS